MGATPAQVLVMGLTSEAFRSPAQFIREVSRVFGQGGVPMYSAIIAASEDPDNLVDDAGRTVVYKARGGGLVANELGRIGERERPIYLHDQRDPDDFAEEDLH